MKQSNRIKNFINQIVSIYFLGLILLGFCTLGLTQQSFAQDKKVSKSDVKNKNANKKTSKISAKKMSKANKQIEKAEEKSDTTASVDKLEEGVIVDEIADVEVPLKDEKAPVVQSPPPDQTSLISNVQPQMVKLSKDKKFKINFEDELISGAQDKPELETIFSRKRMNFKKMIRLRENFIDESEKGKEFFREGI